MHSDAPSLVLIVPAAHGAWSVEPVAHDEPAGQSEHSPADWRLALLEYEPARHGNSADAPAGQKLPAVQALHAVSPPPSWNSPAGHCSQTDSPSLVLIVPAAQGE